jgi:hypothetical protein
MTEDKKMKVIFAPGSLDDFEGTQEELDALVKEIQDLADSGELFERSTPIDEDSFTQEELQEALTDVITMLSNVDSRKLH